MQQHFWLNKCMCIKVVSKFCQNLRTVSHKPGKEPTVINHDIVTTYTRSYHMETLLTRSYLVSLRCGLVLGGSRSFWLTNFSIKSEYFASESLQC